MKLIIIHLYGYIIILWAKQSIVHTLSHCICYVTCMRRDVDVMDVQSGERNHNNNKQGGKRGASFRTIVGQIF